MTTYNLDITCPCIGCVPPKRNGTCHDHCEEYKHWKSIKSEERVAELKYKKNQKLGLCPLAKKGRK